MSRYHFGILVLERQCNLVPFLEFSRFLVMLVVPVFQYGVVNGQWRRIWRKPTVDHIYVATGAALDLCRSKRELMLENALLRQQLIVLRRQVNRPQLTRSDRKCQNWEHTVSPAMLDVSQPGFSYSYCTPLSRHQQVVQGTKSLLEHLSLF
jgi:hypothetical protein